MSVNPIMRVMPNGRRPRGDEGFTLIEMLATIAIMGFVATALTGIMISYFRTTVDTRSRISESLDVQFAATYWQRDVASIGVRTYDSANKAFPLEQSINLTPACALPSGTQVVTLGWSEYTSLDSTAAPTLITVTYVAKPDGVVYDLVRQRCTGSTVDEKIEVAHNLSVVPSLSCNVACAGAGANVPTVVSLTNLVPQDPEGHGNTTPDPVTLVGERRQS